MNYQPLPLIDIPLDLSDEAAAKLIDFLLQVAHQLENHYSEHLYRYPIFTMRPRNFSLHHTVTTF